MAKLAIILGPDSDALRERLETTMREHGVEFVESADETGLDEETQALFFRTEGAALAACAGVICTSAYTAGRMSAFQVPT
mgnify:CR=1 FL=1